MMALPWLIGGAVIIAAGAVVAALSDDDNNSDSSKSSDSDAQNHKETQREVIKKEAEAFLRSKAEDLGSILQELTESFDIKRMIECSSYNFETITREFDNKYYCVLDFVNQKPAYQKVINLMNLDKQLLDEFKVLAYAVNKIYGVETLVLTREFKEMEEDLKEIDNERKEIKSLIEKIQQERTEQFMKDIKGLASNILKSIQL